MTATEWDKFFELLEKIVVPQDDDHPGSWQERADEVRTEAKARDTLTTLEEFASWFD